MVKKQCLFLAAAVFIAAGIASCASAPPEESAAPDYEAESYHIENVDIAAQAGPFTVVRLYAEEYTGGAHPMNRTVYYVFDGGRRIQAADVFKAGPDVEAKLAALTAAALREQAGLSPDQPLSQGVYFDDTPPHCENFFLNADGIGFSWNPYEIAPYSEGQVEAVIPWQASAGLLSGTGLKAEKAFTSK